LFHFSLIGLGFMFFEMLFIQRLTRFLGDPLYATTAVLTSILAFAGAGSAVQSRIRLRALVRIAIGATGVTLLGITYGVTIEPVLGRLVVSSVPVRFAIAVLALFPVSFVLGWQFPAGIEVLKSDSGLLPVAWAANGVASVVAAPLAVLLAMRLGFQAVSIAAVSCFAAVALAAVWRVMYSRRSSVPATPGGNT
jgi:hypothetical protein